ncbi:hypothetical protein GLOIN_2v1488653 [Rhizophagus irregularis DAOM 181602=DAOM 197198]|nr:hypothetical protein GLOIN_2v1488653 [Rhizophagus irregularis DAOM 181602=DAOM 197198]
MDENVNCRFHLPFQVFIDFSREIGGPSRLSNDFSYNRLERHIASLNLSHSKNFRDINRQRENYVSFEKSGTASKDHNDDRTNGNAPLSNCESNMRMLSRKGKDNEIYVQCFNLLQISTNTEENENQQCLGNKIKKGKDANIAVGFRNCSNSGRINELQSSFGELRRVGIMGSVTWRNELPREACHLVHAYPCPVKNQVSMCLASESVENDVLQQDCKNILMVVETFSNKQVCRRVASSYGYKLPADSCDPRELVSYIKQVAEFGFNHIIIIGELDYGMAFMDCFGRLFQWDDMMLMLWPLYNYSSKEANIKNNKFAWFVENDRVVYEMAPLAISPSSESSYSTSSSNAVFGLVKSTTFTSLELELLGFTSFIITLIAGYIKLIVVYWLPPNNSVALEKVQELESTHLLHFTYLQ